MSWVIFQYLCSSGRSTTCGDTREIIRLQNEIAGVSLASETEIFSDMLKILEHEEKSGH